MANHRLTMFMVAYRQMTQRPFRVLVPIALLVILLVATLGGFGANKMKIEDEFPSELESLRSITVFFGHQSVGRNLLAGVQDLSEATGKQYRIGALEDGVDPRDVNMVDYHIGRNEYPVEKVQDFAEKVRNGIGQEVDVALMKFCYVDTRQEQNVEKLLPYYISEVEKLESEFPNTTFIYVTMPLSSPMTGLRNEAKRLLGRIRMVDSGRDENVLRHRFNSLLRQKKESTGRLFDLARVEATKPNGSPYTLTVHGKEYDALYPGYTWDGGHLHENGRKFIAAEFIRFLSQFTGANHN